jgi:3-methylcrotonyl-CoA carboxylase alpha subunit
MARHQITVGQHSLAVEVVERGDGRFRVEVGDEVLEVDARLPAGGPYSLLVGGVAYLVDVTADGDDLMVGVGPQVTRVRVEDPRRPGPGGTGVATGRQRLVAPMPGRVVAVLVSPGAPVEPGAALVVLEAMKMENEFRATVAGVVTEVRVTPGQAVNSGDLLVVVEGGGAGAGS